MNCFSVHDLNKLVLHRVSRCFSKECPNFNLGLTWWGGGGAVF
jgi:hypothetical protein